MILVFGILSLVLGCLVGLVFGILAWTMGNKDLQEIRAGRMDPEGESNTNIGRILGMVATILHSLGVVACCIYFVIMMAVGAAGGHR
jgi:hypothetical protein